MGKNLLKKKSLWMVVLLPLLLLLAYWAPSLFKFSPVEVTKKPASVEKKVFDLGHAPKELKGQQSATFYKFECDSDLDYKLVEENQGSNGIFQVRLKITKAHSTLALPITVWLSQIVPNRRSDFEDGHAKICQRVYVDAHEPAYKACRKVIGRVFFGQGEDRKKAIENALTAAKDEIRGRYLEAVDTKVKDVFVIYDFYAPKWRKSADILVDKALQEYELGKPRKLSSALARRFRREI